MPEAHMGDDRDVYPALSSGPASAGDAPAGMTYGAVLLRADETTGPDVRALLRGIRFSGWVAPAADGWIVVLGDPGDGVVADERRGVIEVAACLAERMPGVVLAARVRRDRQLALVAWKAGEEVGRYCSDPSQEADADEDVLSEPLGSEHAEAFAELCGRDGAGEELAELRGEELDAESVIESERLADVSRMLGLPRWLVASGELPRDIPTGPRAAELMRLRAGAVGAAGHMRDASLRALRRRQQPPPVIADPPTGGGMGFEPWML